MPAAMAYTPDDKDIREAADLELTLRRTNSALAWRYYDGDHKKHLKAKDGKDDNTTVNLCRQVVDRTVSFLVAAFPDIELDELKDTELERDLRNAWEYSGGAQLLLETAQTGCLDGHCFMRVLEARDGEDYPRVVNLDPANVLAFWQADDYKHILWYEIHYMVGKNRYRQDVVNFGTQWNIYQFKGSTEQVAGVATTKWELIGDIIVWPYPLGPIVDWQHNIRAKRFYGEGELSNIGLNDAVNKITSDNRKIVRYNSAPKTIGTGFEAESVTETAIENFWTIEDADAKVYNLEMKSELAASENLALRLRDEFMSEHRVVVLKGDVKDFQRVTNLGVRALFIDQLSKLKQQSWTYAKGIEAVSQRLMMLMKVNEFKTPVKVTLADPLPTDPTEQTTVIEKQRGMNLISKQTAAEELGYNWQLEQERLVAEGDQGALALEAFMRNSQ